MFSKMLLRFKFLVSTDLNIMYVYNDSNHLWGYNHNKQVDLYKSFMFGYFNI